MKLTELLIRRPVVAVVINLAIVIAGVQAIRSLNVREFPRGENAAITVTTVYVGANADLVRGFITTPLERVIASADGIDYMESTSAQGLSSEHEGQTYYFCGRGCKLDFDEDPARYFDPGYTPSM